jgi:hypothetical protein
MSAAAAVLPFVWAIGAELPVLREPTQQLEPQVAFYRKYTEALLRRYVRMAMEAGKVPSLLGQEMFRGKVTNYRVGNFDDVVIFLHDVDRCLEKLDPAQQDLVSRIALQQFTINETAELLGLPPRSVVRRYGQALDRLTKLFLNAEMLEPQKSCQGGKTGNFPVSHYI